MIEYLRWVIAPENRNANIFTFITVVASGIISWLISAVYFRKSNRDTLNAAVFYPIRRLLNEGISADNYQTLIELTKDYSMRYIKNKERPVIEELLSAYENVKDYKKEETYANSLYDYFKLRLRKSGVNTKPVPVRDEGELVAQEEPGGVKYLASDLQKIFENNCITDEEDCEWEYKEEILRVFKLYAKECYGVDKEIPFFDDHSIIEVLKTSKTQKKWDVKYERYKAAKEAFLNMKAIKRL